jgi:hypothetical protein
MNARRISLYEEDIAWLQTRMNAHSDPWIQAQITRLYDEIERENELEKRQERKARGT